MVILAGGLLVWVQRDELRDWWLLRSYDPSIAIAALATDTSMTPYAERLFYVNYPRLDGKAALNRDCSDLAREVAVLGCFKGDRQGIFIYDVADPRLHGIEQVTAAHEMLHQAYERLDPGKRERINGLLENYYTHDLTDQSVKDKVEGYKRTEPGELYNEMHSIFGSEIATLSPELEEYYKQYFTDRQKVVSFRASSQAAFDEYFQQITAYEARLKELLRLIEEAQTSLGTQLAVINQKKAILEGLLAANNVEAYNAGVPEVQNLVNAYNSRLKVVNAQVEEYKRILAERNALAVQANELSKALDSRLTPQ